MLLFEPPPTPADLHFRLLGVPIRVHPFFWVVTALMGLNTQEGTPPGEFISWIVAAFVSIIVHEMGHALVQRRFGGHPWIVLHGIGGMAICDDCDRRPSSQILISLAGPCAGFAFAALVIVAMRATGHPIVIGRLSGMDSATTSIVDPTGFVALGMAVIWNRLPNPAANYVLTDLLWVNIMWGVINLLPVYPLDGGRVMREICTLRDARRGVILSLQISVAVAGAMALFALLAWQSLFTAMLFGYLAYTSFQAIKALRSHGY